MSMTSHEDLGGSLLSLLSAAAWTLSVLASCLAIFLVGTGAFMAITGRFVAFTHPLARSAWRSPRRFGGIQMLVGVTILMPAGSTALSLHPLLRLIIGALAFVPGVVGLTLTIMTLTATRVALPEHRDVPEAD
jgi:hypothetical protein